MKICGFVVALVAALMSAGCSKKDNEFPFDLNVVLKVTVLKSGEIRVDNKAVTLEDLDGLLAANGRDNGVVWYYREAGQEEPPPQVFEIVKLFMKHERPISFSSKPDFSDMIDENRDSRSGKK